MKKLLTLFAFALVTLTANAQEDIHLSCPDGNHPHAINLGLPSGTLWACCNVGASMPEEYGGSYAWGETEEKSAYDWSTYIHYDISNYTCNDIGSDISGTDYDVAHVKWGGSWHMPSLEQIKELLNICTCQPTVMNGVNGELLTGFNGNIIFLPCAEGKGYYWSSEQYKSKRSDLAYDLWIDRSGIGWNLKTRCEGCGVRPVINGTNNNDHEAYHSVFDDSLEWHHAGISKLPSIEYLRKYNLTEEDLCSQFYDQYNLWGTKEKNGKTYHNLFIYRNRDECGVFLPRELGYMLDYPHGFTDLQLGLREEDGRIYMDKEEYLTLISDGSYWHNIADDTYIPYPETSDGELVLYDFTKQAGDVYCSVEGHETIYVLETDSVVTLDNMIRKRLTLSNGYVLIEGIGCVNSPGLYLYYLNPRAIVSDDNVPYFDYSLMTAVLIRKNGKTINVFSQPFWDMVHDVLADGIREVTVGEKADNNMYLPDGRRIAEKPQKGIYIHKGKKRVAK